ncbi:MAG: VOC family protein [Proteobacteria bacterium]|nr:VOC family protein [Pseudomonadota bacterium]
MIDEADSDKPDSDTLKLDRPVSAPALRVNLVTLGVDDLPASTRFYEALGLARSRRFSNADITFFVAGSVVLGLYSWARLAEDANLAEAPRPQAFRGAALAWNCGSSLEVDAAIDRAVGAGARLLKPAQKVFWGGYSGYFADLDGHAWEVAHNPFFPLDSQGRMTLPE